MWCQAGAEEPAAATEKVLGLPGESENSDTVLKSSMRRAFPRSSSKLAHRTGKQCIRKHSMLL